MVIAIIQSLLFYFGIIQYLIANSKRRVNPQEAQASFFLLQDLTTYLSQLVPLTAAQLKAAKLLGLSSFPENFRRTLMQLASSFLD